MPRQQLKPKDKIVLKMTRDGAVEENLTKGTQENVSRRQKDAELVKPAGIQPEEDGEVKKRRKQPRPVQEDGQPSPDTQQPGQENEQPAQQDMAAQENPTVTEGQPEAVLHEEPARAVLRQKPCRCGCRYYRQHWKKPETALAGCGYYSLQSGRDRRRQAGCR